MGLTVSTSTLFPIAWERNLAKAAIFAPPMSVSRGAGLVAQPSRGVSEAVHKSQAKVRGHYAALDDAGVRREQTRQNRRAPVNVCFRGVNGRAVLAGPLPVLTQAV
jgi:hypothetical protein